MTAPVVPLRAAADAEAAGAALAVVSRHLDRCKLAARTVRAYKRQAGAYTTWLAANAGAHGDAFRRSLWPCGRLSGCPVGDPSPDTPNRLRLHQSPARTPSR